MTRPNTKNLDNKELLQILQDAIKHARSIIRKGSTQVENNQYSNEEYTALIKGVVNVRRLPFPPAYEKLFNFIKNRSILSNKAESTKNAILDVLDYEHTITLINKYSLGNCHELSQLGLDFILHHPKSHYIQAEVFSINGKNDKNAGDHVFLVINRDPNSDPEKPETWGKDCYICDSWSNKIFLASEYLDKLENFFALCGKNYTEPFDPRIHVLELNPYFYDKKSLGMIYQVIEKMMDLPLKRAKEEATDVLLMLNKYKAELFLLNDIFHDDNNNNTSISNIIQNRIKKINSRIVEISNMINQDCSKFSTREKIQTYIKLVTEPYKIFNQYVAQLPYELKNELELYDKQPNFIKLFQSRPIIPTKLKNIYQDLNIKENEIKRKYI